MILGPTFALMLSSDQFPLRTAFSRCLFYERKTLPFGFRPGVSDSIVHPDSVYIQVLLYQQFTQAPIQFSYLF